MPISGDTRQALRLLERIQLHLRSSESANVNTVDDDLNTLISVLDSPVFNSILNIQDSLQELKRQLHKHPSILPVDFDISPSTGELVLSVPSDPVPLLNSDSYEPSSDAEPNYDYGTCDSAGKSSLKQDISSESKVLSVPTVAPPDYILSTITTDSYVEEFQKTIDQGAQGREIHNLQLFKPEGSSLGFSVVGLRSEQKGELGIFIQEIQPNGIAGRDGRLQEGDQILAIDGQPLDSNISHQQAISILQQARGLVELVVARGGIALEQCSAPSSTQLERSPSAVSGGSTKDSEMVLNTEWAQVEAIDLINDGSGLGFGIIGGRSTGVVVKTILPGGVADRDGRLQSGDHILQIGDVNLRGMASEQVAMVLRQSGSHVRLVVARPLDPASDGAVLRSHAPVVPTRILADAEEVEKHLAGFQQGPNGYLTEPSPYKGPTDIDANFVYQRELNGTEEYYAASYPPHGLDARDDGAGAVPRAAGDKDALGRVGETDVAEEDLPEMETFEVELVKDQQGLGITIAGYVCEKEEISGIFVKSIARGSAADMCGLIRVNDQIIEVDGRSLHGYTNHQAVEVLRNTGKVVKLRLARYLRGAKYQQLQLAIATGELSYPAPSSIQAQVHEFKTSPIVEAANKDVDVTDFNAFIDRNYSDALDPRTEASIKAKWSKIMGPEYEIVVAQLSKFRDGGGLGISLEGTVDVEDGKEVRPHHYIRSILPDGPVGVNGRLQSGDELLEVNGERLLGMNHHGVVATLKELPLNVRMVCARHLLPVEREIPPSLSQANHSHPYLMDYDLSTVPEFPDRGILSGPFGGSLTSLTPISERLVKAKSDGSLAIGTSASSSPPMEATLSKLKSRSLEPLTGLAMWSSEPQIIELVKGDRGLGFSILDYQDPMNPNETVIVIRSLVPGGVAQQDGRLIPGDRLLFVNDMNLENASLDAAVQALKGAPKGVVRIGVAKPLPLPESSQSGQIPLESSPVATSEPYHRQTFEFPPRLPSLNLDYDQFQASRIEEKEEPVPPSKEELGNFNIASFPVALERTVRIKKGGEQLGLSVDCVGGVAVVKELASDGAVARDGRIETGDFLLAINDCSLLNISEEDIEKVLIQAEKLNTDVTLKFIPSIDAAVHHQSSLIALDKELDARRDTYTVQTESKDLEEEDDEEDSVYFDISDMEPPDMPPPAPPVSEEEEVKSIPVVTPSVIQVFQEEKAESQAVVTVEDKPTSSIPKHIVSSAIAELTKKSAPVRSPKPAVPLKPIRSSLARLDIPSKGKSKNASSDSGLISDISSSSSRQWGPERTVELMRDPVKGLGISIVSGKADTLRAGIFIKNVLSDSPAGWNGTLKRGDRILEVSGTDIRNASHSKAVEVIKNAQNPVKFVIQSLVPLPKKLEPEPPSVTAKISLPLITSITINHMTSSTSLTSDSVSSTTVATPEIIQDSTVTYAATTTPILAVPTLSSPETSEINILSNTNEVEEIEEDSEPPVPPPRTVSRNISRTPSSAGSIAFADAEEEEEVSDNVPETLAKGKVLTKKGVEIDIKSAGNVKLTSFEKSTYPEVEDEFGYTRKKIQKKYGDLKGELIIVDLVKGSNKLGLSLVGNKDRTKMSVFVCGMHPKGLAAKDGRIKIGDELLEVNGLVMYGRCHLNASAMIKGLSGTTYKIVLIRREDSIEEMAVKPLSQFPSELDEEAAEDKYCHYRGMRTVTVRKGAQGLGIMIIEGKHAEVGQGIFISDIQENSAAEQAGLSVGDMILSANDTDLVGADYDTAASILKQAEGLITLIVANPNKPPSGFIYEDEKKNEEIKDCPPEKNVTLKSCDKKKEKTIPPLPPPKPTHLAAKSVNTIASPSPTASPDALPNSAFTKDLVSPGFLSHQNVKIVSIPPLANAEDDALSFQEESEPLPDPKKCDIKPGKETTIEITKEKIGLGLSIVGGSDTPLGAIIIHEVYPDGAAALDGRLKPGDQILEVNGEDLREAAHEHAITTLRQTPSIVTMLVYREEGQSHEDDCQEILEVELHKKPGRGLGLSIVGRKNGPGVFISEVVKGGVAEADGRLIQGDQILEVNNQDLRNATQEHAAAVLKTTMGRIHMKIGRLKAGTRKSTPCLPPTPRIQENLDSPPEYKTITLERGPDGLGFSVVGGFNSPHGDLPIYVKKVFDKGAAAKDGNLKRGDQIISVNDRSLQGLTHEEAVAILMEVTGTVTLTVLQ